jgi:hypothetical protein
LNPDGTLRAGITGGFRANGFRMSAGPDGKPVFRPSKTLGAGDEKWQEGYWLPGIGYVVYAVAVSGTDVYVGGYFGAAGGTGAGYIAKWNGHEWRNLGTGLNNVVSSLAVVGSTLYAGGQFTRAGGVVAERVAKWDGTSWSALGAGVTGFTDVRALAVVGSDLYVGGATIGGYTAALARWNGASWNYIPLYNTVTALAVEGANLYVSGNFSQAPGGVAVNGLAKWDGSAWSALGTGLLAPVTAMAVSGTDLYAASSGPGTNSLDKWNGTAWTSLSGGLNGPVQALAVSGADVYAAGTFTAIGGVAASNVAKWNGTAWSGLGSGIGHFLPPGGGGPAAHVYALGVSGASVYAGGDFLTAGGTTARSMAQWNGTAWNAMGRTAMIMDGEITALAVSGTDVYAGGLFTTGAGYSVSSVAKWDGTNWSFVGTGLVGGIGALAVRGTEVYAAGNFTLPGGPTTYSVARWNGTAWGFIGTGLNGTAQALAVNGSDLYVGGGFTRINGLVANYIAKWNGATWSALGTGMNSYVFALAFSGTDLYVGGGFTTAGGATARYAAKWNGSAWSALGTSGFNGPRNGVDALVVSGTDVYVGGYYTFAKWNGSTWTDLGAGLTSSISSLAVVGTDVYAGGSFTSIGGVAAYYVARWNGTSWNTLGTGVNNNVEALATNGTDVFAGGLFNAVGDGSRVMTNFGVYHPSQSLAIASFAPDSGPVGTSVVMTGSGFTGATAVTIGGVAATGLMVGSDTQLTATVPAGAVMGPVAVRTPAGTAASAYTFIVTVPPTLAALAPASGPVSSSVVLTGTNLSGTTAVYFNGTLAPSFVVNSATQLTVLVPAGATSGPVSVVTPAGTAVSAGSFTVVPRPSLYSFAPATGPVGTSVLVLGDQLLGATQVVFNNTPASFFANSTTQLTATVPPGATTGPITVTTAGGTVVSAGNFVVPVTTNAMNLAQAAPMGLHPNPAHGFVVLQLTATPQSRLVLVLDAVGREVRRQPVAAHTTTAPIDLRGLPTGIYVVRCDNSAAKLLVE